MKGLIRGVIAVCVCVTMVGGGGTAWAQGDEAEAPREQVIDLVELELVANRRAAKTMRMSVEKRVGFERLTRLKKSALPKLQEM